MTKPESIFIHSSVDRYLPISVTAGLPQCLHKLSWLYHLMHAKDFFKQKWSLFFSKNKRIRTS